MKIIILGSNGQLGYELSKTLEKNFNIKTFSKKELDITDFNSMKNIIDLVKPDIVINAAAYTSVDNAEKNPILTYKVNSEAPQNIAYLLEKSGGVLIHFSTDYVFNGKKKFPYLETDEPNPINVYGKSKLSGENKIKAYMHNYFILRTSWVIGTKGKNFVSKILLLSKNMDKIKVVKDQVGVPTSTKLISKVVLEIIINLRSKRSFMPGIYNLVPKGKTNWFEIAKIIISLAEQKNFKFKNNIPEILPIMTHEYPFLAERPRNSLLDTKKISNILTFELPQWQNDLLKDTQKIIDQLNEP